MKTRFTEADEQEIPRPVLRIVEHLDDKHLEGHKRLRAEVEDREKRLVELERQCTEHGEALKSVARRTTDITSIRMSPAVVAAVVLFAVGIVSANYATNSGQRDQQEKNTAKLTAIETAITAQGELKKVETKLDEERTNNMAAAIKRVEARSEMLDLKVNALNEKVSTLTRGK